MWQSKQFGFIVAYVLVQKKVTTDFVSHLMPFHAHVVVVWCYYSRLNSVVLVQKRQRTEPCTICFAIDIYDIIVRANILVHVFRSRTTTSSEEKVCSKRFWQSKEAKEKNWQWHGTAKKSLIKQCCLSWGFRTKKWYNAAHLVHSWKCVDNKSPFSNFDTSSTLFWILINF